MPQTDSPFRYPGGKTQLYRFVSNLLETNKINGTYVEPFAGGAGVAIRLLYNSKVKKSWINDYDTSIYSVWYYILEKPQELINLIEKVPFDYKTGHSVNKQVSIDFWKKQHNYYINNKERGKSLSLAFATLFLNRTNRSGIINGGPVGGYEQTNATQIYARFNKQSLIKKIKKIHDYKDRIILTNYDANDLIPILQKELDSKNSFIFFDPPYFKQGSGLYFTSFDAEGHKTLAKKIMNMTNNYWITTYDVDSHIVDYFKNNKKNYSYELKYSANNKRRGKASELLFASPNLEIESYDNVHLNPLI
ncbi:DNA adenine methylase [Limosilactobacillus sp. RRLNB_1_1]|uniref:site-specific DNA-methyltransferase (adenine-specific) n=1 Tax=Limosilactobacillus albertensis TaxID=2759752 RepID=A0A7W3TR45_9LACO|nr:DNA adenine methylase [Limosilactobacillus albertensis]MBB1069228.1 DNA adenine methylase [Limosilactobacillus albertensis]MCD7118474.1 DNA adenine methylase [Limosilactobacillus albertensis]MCD7128617.1 DNA adenine methylase [Limosilactobacillus albertensis]